MVRKDAPTFGGERGGFVSGGDVFSAEAAGINRPCPRSDHGNGAAENGKSERNPRVARISQCDPQFDGGNNGSCDWSPHSGKEQYPAASSNDLWNHR